MNAPFTAVHFMTYEAAKMGLLGVSPDIVGGHELLVVHATAGATMFWGKIFAGIDLNHGDIAGYLPEELGLLEDLALFHINLNRFCGTLPKKFRHLKILFELDLRNNRFAGKFPYDLDAVFINHNWFVFELSYNFGNSPVSVIVLANNRFHGCLPTSIGNMSDTLNEFIMMNNGLRSCVPEEIGLLNQVTVFDVTYNQLMGPLPESISGMLLICTYSVSPFFPSLDLHLSISILRSRFGAVGKTFLAFVDLNQIHVERCMSISPPPAVPETHYSSSIASFALVLLALDMHLLFLCCHSSSSIGSSATLF
ncbi:hypothetical protein L6452_05306 [Arctium lappa]|uniref:Uncharacterized protein n=1 Tax=Arctium lappa TaxID=4217 RepID=A0ACB9EFF8_ARCLA|nr:hypothetical protein L6452_05306 [Arctium lappa]